MINEKEKYVFQTIIPAEAKILENYSGNEYQMTDRYLIKEGKPWLPASGA